MRNFIRSLEANRVRWLLISGQASVLYGAAAFSEDIDIWVDPTGTNLRRLVGALRDARARVHKRTPPLESGWFQRGHGFHFRLPPDATGPTYLDIMGRPPRVGAFAASLRTATVLSTGWGKVPVVDIPDLVEMKKTRRLADYDVISRLVRIRVATAAPRARPRILAWAMKNTFRLEDAVWMLNEWPAAERAARESGRRWLVALAKDRVKAGEWDVKRAIRLQGLLSAEVAQCQQADVAYWSPIIVELRACRRSGRLLQEGSLV